LLQLVSAKAHAKLPAVPLAHALTVASTLTVTLTPADSSNVPDQEGRVGLLFQVNIPGS
jgi:hypothetical protein